ncbi:MAG TPA: PPA1309 family protein [Nakamurella multipartita]|nr:PPA1309 family protein [Nakamurella multipartita]
MSEDRDLAAALTEVEQFVASAGWDRPVQLFALVRTQDLLAAQPSLAGELDTAVYTPIAQDPLPDQDVARGLAQVSWPDSVTGCVLVQEIVVLPPSAQEALSDDPAAAAAQAAEHPERTEARLVAGVLRSGPRACLLRVRVPAGEDELPLVRGVDLAPNLLDALELTFDDQG